MDKEIKRLVILRLESWPPDIKVAFGSGEELTRDKIIEHVEKEDDLGEEMAEMQIRYLKSLKTGYLNG